MAVDTNKSVQTSTPLKCYCSAVLFPGLRFAAAAPWPEGFPFM